MPEDLVERIYEAAFVPDRWAGVLDEVNAVCGAAASSLLVFDPVAPPRFKATRLTHDSLTAFTLSGAWKVNPREKVAARARWAGFQDVSAGLTEEERRDDPVGRSLAALGLGWQIGTIIPLALGQQAVVTCERRIADGPYESGAIDRLDALRPHLARAVLMAARLGLEQARAAVATLAGVGLPAAVLAGGDRVVAVNHLLEATPDILPGAHGRLILAHPVANRMLREILATGEAASVARSIPVPATRERSAGIVHVMPLRGAAYEIMGGFTLVVLAGIGMSGNVPSPGVAAGLYDLTPREAQLAITLAAGLPLKEAAEACDLRLSTARSYLEPIFRKTGTTQQSQLVALLKGTLLASLP
ncbi:helix-turn-helix transcriptional regulator [Methylobacterium sp. Leaf118]|uniref:helix-turn-helix transcriptional regulator n=1 Tax=Methylobacterium sp. Leaf118 TaxID=2876562 RepID=UPI001E564623|nr:helix-turn-helix transcriptional regulator [Methylobacterium sp. Leaf118]